MKKPFNMNTKLIAIGKKRYVNPYYIAALTQQADVRDNMHWWVHLRDGKTLLVDEDCIENLIRELT